MTNKEKVKVVIDSNEEAQNQELTSILVMHEDIESFSIEPLETGDFIIEDCLFERKTPSDFAGSVKEGRLREQVDRMAKSDYHSYILVEGDMGDFSDLEHTQMPPKSLRGMAASIMARHGIPVVFCTKGGNLVDIAVRIARKTVEDPSDVHVDTPETVKEVPFIVKFFMNFDGIGLDTAEKLAESFETVESVLNADTSDLETVDGVGQTTAATIYNELHGEFDDANDESNSTTHIRI